MRSIKTTLAALGIMTTAGCDPSQMAALTDWGVSPEVQAACIQVVAQELPGVGMDMDFDAAMDRLQDNGLVCLIAAVQGVLTARIVEAQDPDQAGEVVAADPIAESAI